MLLLELLLATGLSFSDILTTLFMAWVVVVTALVGALVRSTYKWGYYALGLTALLYIWWATDLIDDALVTSANYPTPP